MPKEEKRITYAPLEALFGRTFGRKAEANKRLPLLRVIELNSNQGQLIGIKDGKGEGNTNLNEFGRHNESSRRAALWLSPRTKGLILLNLVRFGRTGI